MKKLLLFFLVVSSLSASAMEIPLKTDSTKKTRYSILITGRIETAVYTDSYKNVEQREGLQYYMPDRPSINPVTGEDKNNVGSLRLNAASTRLGIGTKIVFNEKLSIDALIETDFMGASSNLIQSLRMRHAYFKLNIGRSSILFGQTSHLAMVDEIASNTVTYASGFPFNLQSRPVQIRFTQQIGSIVNLAAALSMYTGAEYEMQSWAMTPDISARVMVGDPKRNMIGATVGFKSIMPKKTEVANQSARMNSLYGALFGRVTIGDGYAIRGYAIYGGDLSTLGITGGFATLLDLKGYAPLSTVSTWLDFSTPRFHGFEVGIFGGFQKNLGSATDISKSHVYSAGATYGIDNFWRVAPRVWYHFKMLSFGFEYMYSEALWAHEVNERYQASFLLPETRNNRYTLLARFSF